MRFSNEDTVLDGQVDCGWKVLWTDKYLVTLNKVFSRRVRTGKLKTSGHGEEYWLLCCCCVFGFLSVNRAIFFGFVFGTLESEEIVVASSSSNMKRDFLRWPYVT